MSKKNTAPEVAKMTYSEAMAELEQILRTMQSDNCDIDRLAEYTRRATELIAECRRRLISTDEELKGILADFDAGK